MGANPSVHAFRELEGHLQRTGPVSLAGVLVTFEGGGFGKTLPGILSGHVLGRWGRNRSKTFGEFFDRDT